MQPSPQTASFSMPESPCEIEHSLRAEELAYQAVTVASILLVLGSLWIF